MTGKGEAESRTKYAERDFSEQVDDIRDGKFGENNQAYMGTTPPRLSNILRLPKLPMLVTAKHVTTMALTEEEAKNDSNVAYDPRANYHGLGWDAVKQLPVDMNKPVLIIKSNTDNNSADFVVVTNKTDGNQRPVICAVKPNGRGRYIDIEFNENAFMSGYGKKNILNFVSTAAREGRILYAYKNSQQNNNLPGVQFPDHLMSADYANNLSRFREIVNKKFAGTTFEDGKGLLPNTEYAKYSERDSEGTELSEGQAGYFAESKVRDEDGNLLVVYHGTDADFTVFDRTKGRANMDIQGLFFSPWEDDAAGYGGKVGAYYLNITNPAPEGVAYKALNRFKGQNGAGIKAREYLESLGYDGVNNSGEEYIAFNPEQIKRIDNLNPTTNEDIRYSERDITEGDTAEETAGREKSYAQLRAEIGRLKQQVEYWKGQTKITKEASINEKDVAKLAKRLVRDFETTADVESIRQKLTDMGNYLVRGDANGEYTENIKSGGLQAA